jgi:hypothetical protein
MNRLAPVPADRWTDFACDQINKKMTPRQGRLGFGGKITHVRI